MAVFLYHGPCSRCTSSDALAHYSDGATYCFSCGSGSGSNAASFSAKEAFLEEEDEELPLLPSDLSRSFPQEVLEWVQPTGVTYAELIRNGYFFSRTERGLLRVLSQERLGGTHSGTTCDGRVSGRNPYEVRRIFRNDAGSEGVAWKGPKTLFRGNKEDTYGGVQPLDGGRKGEVCIVEDSLSAIKVGRVVDGYPLFGSSVSKDKLTRITQGYDKVFVWLDSDKLNNARQIAEQCLMLGKRASVIHTDLDPKYLDANDWLL